ncbi:MAG: DUF1566 domain-containing protein [Nitrospirae bacterium]|nr:DUF1566 domain-containing protein [Nitrospirota bacterium]MBF0592290.1 DUF1566 domain-containing protein [Nitrospirota bacterium]
MRKVSYLLATLMVLLILPALALAGTAIPLQTGQKLCFIPSGTYAGNVQPCKGTFSSPGTETNDEDGYYRTGLFWNKSRFSLVTSGTTSGTIVDNTTGLVWPADPTALPSTCGINTPGTGTGITWSNALLYIGCLNSYTSSGYLGISTWRLPNIIELMSLMNRGHGESTSATDSWTTVGTNSGSQTNDLWLRQGGTPGTGNTLNTPFTGFAASAFWSSTSDNNTNATTYPNAWTVDMTSNKNVSTVKTGTALLVPVSGTTTVLPLTGQTVCYNTAGSVITCSTTGQDGEKQQGVAAPGGLPFSASRFSAVTASDGKKAITDSYTGLVWSATNTTGGLSGYWHAAMNAIYAINTGSGYSGYTDWRMPNVNELVSLLNFGAVAQDAWLRTAGFDSAVAVATKYWTATASDIDTTSRYIVDLTSGVNGAVTTAVSDNSTTARYLMVRGGQFNITGTSNNTAYGSVACSPSTVSGSTTSSTCTITPTTGYQAGTTTDNGDTATASGDATSSQTYTISNVGASHVVNTTFGLRTFTITLSNTDSHLTYSAGCGSSSGTGFAALSTQVCQVTPSSGYAVSIFNDNGLDKLSSLSGGTTYTMTNLMANHTLYITAASAYPITASVSGTGGTISCSPTSVASGLSTVCTVVPSSGYALSTLTDNSVDKTSSVTGGTSYTITNVKEPHTVIVTFAASYTVSGVVTGTGGTNSCTSPVASGSKSTCTITPSSGYALQSLSDGGTDVTATATATWDGTKYTYTTTAITANRTVTATFGASYTITASVTGGAGGTITCTPSTVLSGQSSVCSIKPTAGYGILSLIDNGTAVSTSNIITSDNVTWTYTISAVAANHTVSVLFLSSYGVVTSVVGTGTLSCTPTNPTSGSTVVCTITPGSGQKLVTLTDNGTNVTSQVTGGTTYTITNIASNHSVVATFSFVPVSYGIVYKGDFNGDGLSDLLWISTSTNMVAVWFMGNGTYTKATSYGYVPTGWVVRAISDFDNSKRAEILWQNTTTGQLAMWSPASDGMSVTASAVTLSGAPISLPSNWSLLGTGDFIGTGAKQDILWQDITTGNVAIWHMSGSAITTTTLVTSLPSTWQFKGIADFDGNGTDDILWQSPSTGQIVMWIMNGTAIKTNSVVSTLTSDWVYKGAASFDGSAKATILWQNSTSGMLAMWPMNGATIGTPASPGTLNSSWVFKGVGMFGAATDKTADILWQNTDGTVATWLMNGSTITSPVGSGVIPSDWVIQ